MAIKKYKPTTPGLSLIHISMVLLAALVYLLIRPYKESRTLEVELKETAKV